MGATAAAQQTASPRAPQRVQVLVPSGLELVPEVRVAAHEATYLHFDAPVDRASVEVEGKPVRFKWLDVGDSLIGFEPSVDLGAEEKLVVRARYKDGASPATVTLALVTRPSVVDKEVAVVRRALSREALEAKLAETAAACAALKAESEEDGLFHAAFSGLLDAPINVKSFEGTTLPGYSGGLQSKRGLGYRSKLWAMVVLQVSNRPGRPPWAIDTARLTGNKGTPVKVRSVHMAPPRIEPGSEAIVGVVVEPPPEEMDRFQLDLVDTSGSIHRFVDISF